MMKRKKKKKIIQWKILICVIMKYNIENWKWKWIWMKASNEKATMTNYYYEDYEMASQTNRDRLIWKQPAYVKYDDEDWK